jgi:hypothetical protein
MLRAITPSDSEELEFITNGIIPGTSGTISIIAADDTDPVPVPVNAGQQYSIRAKKIMATGTTATGIVALIS